MMLHARPKYSHVIQVKASIFCTQVTNGANHIRASLPSFASRHLYNSITRVSSARCLANIIQPSQALVIRRGNFHLIFQDCAPFTPLLISSPIHSASSHSPDLFPVTGVPPPTSSAYKILDFRSLLQISVLLLQTNTTLTQFFIDNTREYHPANIHPRC